MAGCSALLCYSGWRLMMLSYAMLSYADYDALLMSHARMGWMPWVVAMSYDGTEDYASAVLAGCYAVLC
eukprot:12426694-Karenia_brevis.AAC.2